MTRLDELKARRASLRGDLAAFTRQRDEARGHTRIVMTSSSYPSRRDMQDYLARNEFVADETVADLEKALAKVERQIQREERLAAGERMGIGDRIRALLSFRSD